MFKYLTVIDPTSFAFLLMVALMGGGIAVLADNLGRKIGKRRHTLGRLRPRHTATLFTFGAGFLIPIFVVLAVMAASESVRRWILEGNRVNEQLRIERTQLGHDIQQKTHELEQASEQYRSAQSALVAARSEVSRLTSSEQALAKSVADLEQDAGRLRRELKSVQGKLQTSTNSLTEVQERLKNLNQEYSRVFEDYNSIQQRNLELTSKNAQFEKDLLSAETRLKDLGDEIERLTNESVRLDAQRTALQATNEQLATQLRAVDTALAAAQKDLAEEQLRLESARRETAFLQAQLSANIDASRRKSMIFRMNEEVTRITVEPSQTVPEARNIVTSLLRSSRIAAEEKGALPSEVEALPSAGVWPVVLSDGRIVSATDQENEIARAITAVDEPLVIIASARWNVFEGEPVPLEISIFRNKLIFRAGQIISETRVDGRASEDEVLKAIERFLNGAVRNRALESGLIPVQGPELAVGFVTSEEVLNLMRSIKETNREVRLVAFTDMDVRAADRLRLKFRMN